ncbi:biotin--[acetyl-CoA-carboxylase] ligase [Roseovarius sp. M141]|uniref:biotin--[acetyl-CoA-carboxylase] ligase n=1 Tax=Roseovarius sp. M141 TaxID=2583806 RepID=UPI0020CE6A7D|nr:biotin--[acetyl-CoA-carboxylase] ligase [Roseovarius sp. M141]MCQ0092637.1 biotin--[acetyl-CoA-carboxylase] ligase [Roseovarius sp. M141]
MKDPVWPVGYGRHMLPEVDSTNAEGMRLASELAGPTWIFAARQIAGRGRRGRVWGDPEGNFAASLVLRPAEPPERAALRSFVASLALYDALSALAPGADLALKWPNDVLLSEGKLAGILLEGSSSAGRLAHLVIGIGVNLAGVPVPGEARAVPPVSLLSGTGVQVTPERLLDHLAAAYGRREAVFVRDGFAPIRADWLARAARLGQIVTARTMREETTGRFETVDEDGNLVLSTAGGRRAIPAADVFF